VGWYLKTVGLRGADLTQAGMLGLCEAATRFKPELGFAFSTYALHWVRKEVVMAHKKNVRWYDTHAWSGFLVDIQTVEANYVIIDFLLDIRKILSPKLWVIFRLKYGRGLNEQKIAQEYKCTRQWINLQVRQGLRQLSEAL
jgi:RNA polymerase sigma factor (sigma-70 family)